jgi:two-component system sensor histidine kinase DegS
MTVRAKRPKKDHRALSARYLADLRAHLLARKPVNGDHAHGVGRAAVLGGLEPRELALIHERALVDLASSFDFLSAGNSTLARAGHFLSEAMVPLDAAQRATRDANRLLQQRNDSLRLHAASLARMNRRLQQEVSRRKAVEEAVKKGKQQYQKLFVESQVMEKKLRLVTRQIIAAQEAERKEISRELHDEVVQTLVGINVQLSALCQGTSIGLHTLKAKIIGTQRLVENSVTAVHRFARGLRPAVLDDLGLIPALHAYCKSLSAQKKVKIQLTAFRSLETLDSNGRTVLYRVAQEALTNVSRHAQATRVTVAIADLGKTVRMEIADNGKSFSVEKTLFAKNNKRLGLIGMKERIEMIGGALTILSIPGAGTTVRAEIPFNREKS